MSSSDRYIRDHVYKVIDEERDYQDRVWPTTTNGPEDHRHTVGEELVLLKSYLDRAFTAWTDNEGDDATLHVMRKIAAIAVRCLETHGAPRRGN